MSPSPRTAIGFLYHPAVPRDLPVIESARQWLAQQGIEIWDRGRQDQKAPPAGELARTRLIVTLGGDGTFLNGARLAVSRQIDVLGVNFGRLGFLTELDAHDLQTGLERYLEGTVRIDERCVLEAVLNRGGRSIARLLAINEVTVHQAADPRLIRLEIAVDGREVGTFDADGVLVATATGSTAYALALGGPIMEPELMDMVMVPINPFALTVRPILFSPATRLTIRLPRYQAALRADGISRRRLVAGDAISVAGFGRRLRTVRLSPNGAFFETLRQKLGWGTPLVPYP